MPEYFVRLVDRRGYRGDPKRAASWHGFGEPVLAPADGTVVGVLDGRQHIGVIGDSGNSLAPHLHFHMHDRPETDETIHTVPIVFRDVVLIRGGRESTPAGADLRRGDHIRRISG